MAETEQAPVWSRFLSGRNPSTGHRGRHSATIAAEYLACMTMILASFGMAGKNTNEADVLAAPVVVMVRLSAVTLLFFALAIASTGEQLGRLASAFGLLVTLGVALNATNEWKALAAIFSPSSKKAS